jgi:uncharacterized membrane protein
MERMQPMIYMIAFCIFIGIDLSWLGLATPQFYRSQIGHLMADTSNLPAAGLFYLLYVWALVYFVVEPALSRKESHHVGLRGALFGLVAYATYDLTNLATLRDWPVLVTVADMIWGAVLTAVTSMLSVWVAKNFLP